MCTMAGALQVFPVTSVFSACGTHTGVTAVDGSDEKNDRNDHKLSIFTLVHNHHHCAMHLSRDTPSPLLGSRGI